MKKILVSTLIAIMVGATLTGCGNSGNGNNSIQQGQQTSLSAKEIVEKLGEEELFMMPMMKVKKIMSVFLELIQMNF